MKVRGRHVSLEADLGIVVGKEPRLSAKEAAPDSFPSKRIQRWRGGLQLEGLFQV